MNVSLDFFFFHLFIYDFPNLPWTLENFPHNLNKNWLNIVIVVYFTRPVHQSFFGDVDLYSRLNLTAALRLVFFALTIFKKFFYVHKRFSLFLSIYEYPFYFDYCLWGYLTMYYSFWTRIPFILNVSYFSWQLSHHFLNVSKQYIRSSREIKNREIWLDLNDFNWWLL